MRRYWNIPSQGGAQIVAPQDCQTTGAMVSLIKFPVYTKNGRIVCGAV
jgi:hypothetical protein